jgi:hypothetical protein
MTKTEMEIFLSSLLQKDEKPIVSLAKEWESLEEKFNCIISDEFKNFIELMSFFSFPGGFLNITDKQDNDHDLISFIYDSEMENGEWNVQMIPFYGLGNGDYFCINSKKLPQSPVYFYDHEISTFEVYTKTFEEWVLKIEDFL